MSIGGFKPGFLYLLGNMGGRESPRPSAIPQADETWTTVGRGPRTVNVDPKKFQNIKVSTMRFCLAIFFLLC